MYILDTCRNSAESYGTLECTAIPPPPHPRPHFLPNSSDVALLSLCLWRRLIFVHMCVWVCGAYVRVCVLPARQSGKMCPVRAPVSRECGLEQVRRVWVCSATYTAAGGHSTHWQSVRVCDWSRAAGKMSPCLWRHQRTTTLLCL